MPPDYCEYPLVEESLLSASSDLVTREADKARLYGEVVVVLVVMAVECSVRWAFNTRHWRPGAREWSAALALVQPEEKERITRFMFRRDAKSALAGRLLLRRMADEVLGVPWATADFRRTEHGRPCLVTPQNGSKHLYINVDRDLLAS
ncbi:L-aminoadipate-semialdehyde dehydrogenase-phosphopantetheinyl transferase [Chionoecetes opilio]|uniref:holo-[acyl-carrier-protein] synthase n=1 Tax=Chionoecetes opilio TaxID=41210 RepID=A0A8J5D244_CHIOP|nr:L-aminoadipate-semialdehyde dehydrogenase-phosphopantetheinyl transferase [Chionoecetes opilio]